MEGNFTSARRLFAFLQVDERYGDVATLDSD
jgi:hypothetical protein